MAETISQMLPYERIADSRKLAEAFWLRPGQHLLVLQPFGWHLDGHHIPNAAEHFSRDGICREHHWQVVCDFGPYIAIIEPHHD